MEEKISFERPRPFSSGFLIPFHQSKNPIELVIQTSKIEIFPKTMAIYIQPESIIYNIIESFDTFAVELLQQYNNAWFKNDLTRDTIREKYSRTLSSDSYIQIRCSHSHPPKRVFIDDVYQEDWTKVSKILDKSSDTMDTIYISLVCHGIYVQKKGFSLLWKIPKLTCYTMTDIAKDTDIDDCKEDIEGFWEKEIIQYEGQVHKEIEMLQASILAKKQRVQKYMEVLQSCKKYTSTDPEWNSSIEYIKQELFKYRTSPVL